MTKMLRTTLMESRNLLKKKNQEPQENDASPTAVDPRKDKEQSDYLDPTKEVTEHGEFVIQYPTGEFLTSPYKKEYRSDEDFVESGAKVIVANMNVNGENKWVWLAETTRPGGVCSYWSSV
jgi:hypothetical protein